MQSTVREGKAKSTKSEVVSISIGHLLHDLYTSFLAPMLPGLIDRLSLSLTSAGVYSTLLQIPSVLNPLIGYIADKKGVRYFVIFSPALTATLMSLIGITNQPILLGGLLLAAGISSASFHATSPAIVGKASEKKTGLGMSFFMAGGGLGRTLGPLLVVWAVGYWGLENTYRLMFFGWAASIFLFFRFREIDIRPKHRPALRQALPKFRKFFIPLALILLLRSFMIASTNTYLPTFMTQSGAPLWLAGAALSAVELAGVGGGLVLGPVSDNLGRKSSIGGAMLISSLALIGFLFVDGWMVLPFLLILGFFSRSTGPLFLALVQDHFQGHRATSNGLFMLLSFLSTAVMLVLVGFIGDQLGLRTAYFWSAFAAVFSILPLALLPTAPENDDE